MPTTDDDTNPQSHQKPIHVAPDGRLDVPASVARQGTRGSRRTVAILVVSFGLAAVAMGGYWLSQARGLQEADRQPGETSAHGQKVTDPNAVAMFHAPEPQPKQPSADQVAQSSTPTPTLTVPAAGDRR